jgi:Bax protein
MKKKLLLMVLTIAATAAILPHMLVAAKPAKPTVVQTAFIDKMRGLINKHNHFIKSKRQQIIYYQKIVMRSEHLTLPQEKQLTAYAQNYHIKTCSLLSLQHNHCFKDLLNRVNTLPVGLVLAQAINESDWGRSRFAKEGNNYFGIWCYQKGCGMVPRSRPNGQHYEVRRFNSAAVSIAAYFKIINTHKTYDLLRSIRAKAAAKGKVATAYQLAEGLEGYSTRRQAYVRSIRHLINRYAL